MKVDFFSQPMARDGSSIAQFASQAIKDSILLPKHVMLREALQNSCDQRISKEETIDFTVSAFALHGDRLKFLKVMLQEGLAKGDPLEVSRLLNQDRIEILVFADKGTKGLGGIPDASKPNAGNFARYFYIFGRIDEPGSTDGGSFGAGRTTLNNASQISTVFVYSNFRNSSGKLHSRFMGLANGKSFEHEERMYTGRHWWCDYRNEHAHPFEGEEAREIAINLGMDEYLKDETGFVAFVIAPIYVGLELQEKADNEREALIYDLQQAAYLYGWPHMIEHKGKKSVNFSFFLDGKKLENQDPGDMGHLVNFVESYSKIIKARESNEYDDERIVNINFTDSGSQKRIGILGWSYSPEKKVDVEFAETELIPRNSVALIRNAGFVVKYEPVNPYADGIVTRGVFLADLEYEGDFRASEPIAHDAWIPSRLRLTKGSRNPVKQCLDQIRSTFKSINDPQGSMNHGEPIFFASNVLGAILGGLPVVGKNQHHTRNSKTSKKKSPVSFSTEREPYVISSNKEFYRASFAYAIEFKALHKDNAKLTIEARVGLEGGKLETDPPSSGYRPRIASILIDDYEFYRASADENFSSRVINLSIDNPIQDLDIVIESKHGIAVFCKLVLE